VALAFEAGRAYERADLAALDAAVWKPLAQRTREQLVAERIAEMEQHAGRLAVELFNRYGRIPWKYHGGPVDWETGRPLNDTSGVAA
jgi:hypothetical protein